LPFLSGERAPGWCPNATASILGLTKQTTGADVYRAGMEAVALRLAAIVRLMRPHLGQNLVVGASGTALERSGLWRQILADALGLEVVLEEQGEATSKGVAALMAEWRFEEEPLREAATQEQVLSRHTPHQDAYAAYQEALQQQDALYSALHPPESGDHATSDVALYN
jgi:gluconokinase